MPSGLLLGLTAESQALDTETKEAGWDGGGARGSAKSCSRKTIHPWINRLSPLPSHSPSPLNNPDLLPSCIQATPLRLPRMSHSDRAIYEDAAGEDGQGRGQGSHSSPAASSQGLRMATRPWSPGTELLGWPLTRSVGREVSCVPETFQKSPRPSRTYREDPRLPKAWDTWEPVKCLGKITGPGPAFWGLVLVPTFTGCVFLTRIGKGCAHTFWWHLSTWHMHRLFASAIPFLGI